MQVGVRSLLAASLVAWVASCTLNNHGLESSGTSQTGAAGQVMGATGAAGALPGIAGDTGSANASGSGGMGAVVGTTGAAGAVTGAAGDPSGAAGDTSGTAGDTATGAAGATTGVAGAGGATASGGAGSNAGGGSGGISATAGSGGGGTAGTAGSGAAGSIASDPGCSDGTREGYLDMVHYPYIAACAGAWDTPGLDSTDARTPQCDRRGGNDGDKPDGHGCSVADLCESGWHVCTTAHGVALAAGASACTDAVAPSGDKPVFFVTRQRATGLVCDTNMNPTGTNNLYGCGNIGSTADKTSCTPLTRMMRDSDCLMNSPWMCSDGPNGTSQDEYNIVTKGNSSRGGVLCCHD